MVSAPHAPAPRDDRPTHVADLLRLVTRDPGRPRITWYGDDGERVELSGAVLENWVNKTTNLLVEEFDAGPGTRVVLDLPVHWRTVVWALAAWRVGATAVLVDENATGPGGTHADVVVTHRPDAWTGSGAELVAVALPALARRFDGALPAGAVDAASAVMTYGDQVGWAPEPDRGAVAVEDGAAPPVVHGDLVASAQSPAGGTTGARVLLRGDGSLTDALRGVVAVLADDGSVVQLSAGRAHGLAQDDEGRARLVATERITVA
ncbi:TIGR03089 family protein [Cellulosimicrobium cellulans]|uniref:TIGR03089 family protein n=1 Tax=Cellulosimicrobium cellulans TaxID=1710 RepID=UPI0018845137|nr:TIGR03089 family protein [Cellulosimicrobium cellulans]MBE9925727.1 TIGR03089 family protein [Cellulosimicrobium cellulans]